MTTEQLFALLESDALYPVQVEEEASSFRRTGLVMVGTLERFIKSTQALGEKVVFITIRCLSESDFVYERESDEEEMQGDNASPFQTIPLATVCPEIDAFKSHLNQECTFTLSVFFKQSVLHYSHSEPWWLEFQTLQETAITAIAERAKMRRETLEEERKRELEIEQTRQQALVEQLRALITNREFFEFSSKKNTTQRGMQVAALEMIPPLRELNPSVFKLEMQALSDRIKAQQALQKK